MTYEETLHYLYTSIPVFQNAGPSAYKPGLGTSIALDDHLGNPHKAYKTIHVAGTNGKWTVTLDPLRVSGKSYTLTVSTPSRTLNYRDVVAGEVWLCSGQSNMAFRVNESVKEEQQQQLDYAKQHSQIRLFDLKPRWETYAVEWDASVLDSLNRLQYYHDAQWEVCDTRNTARFSAIGFAFGRMLADSLQVPVG